MILPADFSLLCKINYKNYKVYQKVSLKDFEFLTKKFPAGTYVDALVYKPNKIYGWSRIKSVRLGEQTSTQIIRTDKRGLSFTAPKFAKDVKFVTLPKGFFEEASSVKEAVLGVLSSSYVKDFKIKATDRARAYGIASFVQSNIQSFSNIVLDINRSACDISDMHRNIRYIFYDYLTVHDKYPIDVYLTHILIQNRMLVPLILGGEKPVVDEDTFRVPMSTYWLFQLLYGREKSVYCEIVDPESWGKIDVRRLETRLKRTYTPAEGACLELASTNVQPIIIDSFAMRFV